MAVPTSPQELRIVAGDSTVAALLDRPADPFAGYVFAHGAGAGMHHSFMAAMARALCDRGVATLRFQFPFMERGTRRVDSPAIAHAAIRAAVTEAARQFDGLRLFAGGKSFGGRMSSQAQAAQPLPGVCGLVFVGFPLHPAGKPATTRAQHLSAVQVPMLFLQGTRDALADLSLVREIATPLADRATLHEIEQADHAFAVPARLGRKPDEVIADLAHVAANWMRTAPHC